MPTRDEYEFQKCEKNFVAGGDNGTKHDTMTFAKHLNIQLGSPAMCPPSVAREIELYVTRVQRNILYYVMKRSKEQKIIYTYILFTIVVAVAMPIFAYRMPYLALKGHESASTLAYAAVIPAQITAVLTGVFVLHKLVTLWVFRRNSIHACWKASCQLKSILYSFEDEWKDSLEDAPSPAFVRALRKSRLDAEKIVELERDSFFESFGKTSVDLQAMIKSASSDATDVAGKIADPMIKELAERERKQAQQGEDLRKARTDVVKAAVEVQLLEQRTDGLDYRQRRTSSEEVRKAAISELTKVNDQLADAKMRLDEARATLKAKTATGEQAPIA